MNGAESNSNVNLSTVCLGTRKNEQECVTPFREFDLNKLIQLTNPSLIKELKIELIKE